MSRFNGNTGGSGGGGDVTLFNGVNSTSVTMAATANAVKIAYDKAVSVETIVNGKANTSHIHTIANITGLQTALDGKAATTHTHAISSITNLQSVLDGKAVIGHTHNLDDLGNVDFSTAPLEGQVLKYVSGAWKPATDLSGSGGSGAVTSVNGKTGDVTLNNTDVGAAPNVHVHAVSDVTGLQTILNGKAASTHNHTLASLSDVNTTAPLEGQVLKYVSGAWTPSSDLQGSGGGGSTYQNMVYVDDFAGANDSAKIQAAIDYCAVTSNQRSIVMLTDRNYNITSTIVVKGNVELRFGHNTTFNVTTNIRVIELQRDAFLRGAYISVYTGYSSEVLYLNGAQKFNNTFYRTGVEGLTIVNQDNSGHGTGIYLYAGTNGANIQYVNFRDVKITGMNTAIRLHAVDPADGSYAWVNANRFIDLTTENCVNHIVFNSAHYVPNECAGNIFSGWQVQADSKTNQILNVNSQYNVFDGVMWDFHLIPHSNPLVVFNSSSSKNVFDFPTMELNRVQNNNALNYIVTTASGGGGSVTSVNGKTGVVTLNNTDVGAAPTSHTHSIGNITNLQSTLDGKISSSLRGVANGVAGLNASGQVIDAAGNVITGGGGGGVAGDSVFVSITTGGAVAGSTSDQSSLIQSVLSSNKLVYFPAGEFTCFNLRPQQGTTIVFHPDCVLKFPVSAGTTGGGNRQMFLIGFVSDVTEGNEFDGFRTIGHPTIDATITGASSTAELEGFHILGAKNVHIDGATGIGFYNGYVVWAGAPYTENEANVPTLAMNDNVTIRNINSIDSGWGAVAVTAGRNFIIENVYAEGGIYPDGAGFYAPAAVCIEPWIGNSRECENIQVKNASFKKGQKGFSLIVDAHNRRVSGVTARGLIGHIKMSVEPSNGGILENVAIEDFIIDGQGTQVADGFAIVTNNVTASQLTVRNGVIKNCTGYGTYCGHGVFSNVYVTNCGLSGFRSNYTVAQTSHIEISFYDCRAINNNTTNTANESGFRMFGMSRVNLVNSKAIDTRATKLQKFGAFITGESTVVSLINTDLSGNATANYYTGASVAQYRDAFDTSGGTGGVAGVSSINGLTGDVTLTNTSVGAAAATHSHIISEITGLQTALDGKISTSLLGVANGVARLNSSGQVVDASGTPVTGGGGSSEPQIVISNTEPATDKVWFSLDS